MPADVVVSINDDFSKRSGSICRCRFGDVESLCIQDAHEKLSKEYGPDYMTPDRPDAVVGGDS